MAEDLGVEAEDAAQLDGLGEVARGDSTSWPALAQAFDDRPQHDGCADAVRSTQIRIGGESRRTAGSTTACETAPR